MDNVSHLSELIFWVRKQWNHKKLSGVTYNECCKNTSSFLMICHISVLFCWNSEYNANSSLGTKDRINVSLTFWILLICSQSGYNVCVNAVCFVLYSSHTSRLQDLAECRTKPLIDAKAEQVSSTEVTEKLEKLVKKYQVLRNATVTEETNRRLAELEEKVNKLGGRLFPKIFI